MELSGSFRVILTALCVMAVMATMASATGTFQKDAFVSYPIIDTGQSKCYNSIQEITCPQQGQAFSGQDAQYSGNQPDFQLSDDGLTVYDKNTDLIWQRSPDTNGDGSLTISDKLTWTNVQLRPANLNAVNFGGYSDWRIPTIKELYSLINFRGTDPSSFDTSTFGLTPFINTDYFTFQYGQISDGERIIDSQYASGTLDVAKGWNGDKLFGVNFADGRIKGYGLSISGEGGQSFGGGIPNPGGKTPMESVPGLGGQPVVRGMPGTGEKTFFVICVRGNPDYGKNDFIDTGDGTVTDRSTGLMWTQSDSDSGMNWGDALSWVQTKNESNYLGHNDWRLPNAKELQSIVDYTRSPDTTSSAAIDPVFFCTRITNEAGQEDYPFYWTGTTHVNKDGSGRAGVYIAFGRAMGYMNGQWQDVHGAGAQRSDPKIGNAADYPQGRGPQGDAIRITNYVRMVRDISPSLVTPSSSLSSPAENP